MGRVVIALPLAFLVCFSARADVHLDVRVIPSYLTGDFGTGFRTEIKYLPLTYRVTTSRHDFRVTLPYLFIRTEESVTIAGGDIISRDSPGETTDSGPGDIVLQEEYFFMQGGARRPWVSGSLRVKLPTADESKGLGTGELDYEPGAGLIQPLGERWSLLADLSYVIRGDPDGVDFRNTLWASAGTQVRLSDSASISILADSRQSVIPSRDDVRSLSLGYSHRLSDSLSLRSALFAGLSDTAEDWGGSLGLSFRIY